MNPALDRFYCEALHQSFGRYFGNCPPNTPLALCSIGSLRNGVFEPTTDLTSAYKFPKVTPSMTVQGTESEMQFQYGRSITVSSKSKGDASAGGGAFANAGLSIKFGKGTQVYFHARNCEVSMLKDPMALGRDLVRLYGEGLWAADHCVVTSLVRAERLTVLISHTDGALVDLEVEGASEIHGASFRNDLDLKYESGLAGKIIAKESTIPMVGLSRVTRKLFGGGKWTERYLNAGPVADPEKERNEVIERRLPFEDEYVFAQMVREGGIEYLLPHV